MSRLDERVAVVTGASRGIGRATALELARRGARVVINYNQSAGAADEVVQAIRAEGSEATAVQADVTDMAQAQALVKQAVSSYGQVDILVNNAGTTRDMLFMMMSESDWDDVIRINLRSAFNCTKAVMRPMMRQRYGRIINMASAAGVMGNAGQANYSASKAGLIGFTKALARELGSRSITVNAIAPGFVPTDLTQSVPEAIREGSLQTIALGRWGTPEEVAYAVAFLASDEASYITGHVLAVDGGLGMISG